MGYSAFRRERALAIDRQGAEAAKQAAEIARLERFVERFRAGTRSRQAASRQKRLDRTERVQAPRRERHLAFGFPRAERSGRVVIEADGLEVGVAGRTLVSGVGFTLERGQRVAVVGPNGAGKTTLIETLIGRRPARAGRVSVGHRVEAGLLLPAGRRPARRPHGGGDGAWRRATSPRARRARCWAASCSRGDDADAPRRAPLGRRAAAPGAGGADRPRRQPAGARRADEPPRHREPRGARGRPSTPSTARS